MHHDRFKPDDKSKSDDTSNQISWILIFDHATKAYLDLNLVVEQIYDLIKVYTNFINQDSSTISDLSEFSASNAKDSQKSDVKPLSSLGDTDDDPSSHEIEFKSIDINKTFFGSEITNQWGACTSKWLNSVTSSIHAAKSMWLRESQYRSKWTFLHSSTSPGTLEPWEKHIQTLIRIEEIGDSRAGHTFDQVATILKHSNLKSKFDGSAHAELIVASELFEFVSDPAMRMSIGISSPPYWICYRILSHMLTQCLLKCRSMTSSEIIWNMDISADVFKQFLLPTFKELSKIVAVDLVINKNRIEKAANEAKNQYTCQRSSSDVFLSSDSTTMPDDREMGRDFYIVEVNVLSAEKQNGETEFRYDEIIGKSISDCSSIIVFYL